MLSVRSDPGSRRRWRGLGLGAWVGLSIVLAPGVGASRPVSTALVRGFTASSTAAGQHPDIELELFGTLEPSPDQEATEVEGREAIESELFGPPSDEGELSNPDRPPDVGAARATPTDLLDDLRATLEATSDRLAIGGDLFLRVEYRGLARGGAETFALVSPSTLDLYLDARPIDRVRTYVRGRLAYDATVIEGDDGGGLNVQDLAALIDVAGRAAAGDDVGLEDLPDLFGLDGLLGGGQRPRTDVFLDQLWLKFDVDQRVFLTVGKQRIRWGTGRIWNPTDFLNAQRFDPLALFDPRLGVGLIKVHVPFEAIGANVYAIANLDGADRVDRVGVATRGEIAFEQTELALSGSWRRDEPLRLGVDASTGLGPFELRVEAAFLYDVRAPFFRGRFSSDPLAFDQLEARYREDELIPQVVAGGDMTLDYGDGDQAIFGLEYFYNDAGYDSAEVYPALILAPAFPVFSAFGVPPPNGLRGPPPLLFQPLYLGRHYLSAFALFPSPLGLEDHSFTLTGIANLSDLSAVARLDHALRLFRFLSLRSYVNVHLGNRGEFRFGIDVGAVPLLLDEGLSVPPPTFELGFALNATL